MAFVDEVRVEGVELVALYNLGRRILGVVMCLVVLLQSMMILKFGPLGLVYVALVCVKQPPLPSLSVDPCSL